MNKVKKVAIATLVVVALALALLFLATWGFGYDSVWDLLRHLGDQIQIMWSRIIS